MDGAFEERDCIVGELLVNGIAIHRGRIRADPRGRLLGRGRACVEKHEMACVGNNENSGMGYRACKPQRVVRRRHRDVGGSINETCRYIYLTQAFERYRFADRRSHRIDRAYARIGIRRTGNGQALSIRRIIRHHRFHALVDIRNLRWRRARPVGWILRAKGTEWRKFN